MAAYLIATIKSVHQRHALEEYWSRAGATFGGTGAKHLAVYTPFQRLEGEGLVAGVVVLEFPDREAARRWYESAAYQEARQHRLGAADIDILLVEGGVVPPELRMR